MPPAFNKGMKTLQLKFKTPLSEHIGLAKESLRLLILKDLEDQSPQIVQISKHLTLLLTLLSNQELTPSLSKAVKREQSQINKSLQALTDLNLDNDLTHVIRKQLYLLKDLCCVLHNQVKRYEISKTDSAKATQPHHEKTGVGLEAAS